MTIVYGNIVPKYCLKARLNSAIFSHSLTLSGKEFHRLTA